MSHIVEPERTEPHRGYFPNAGSYGNGEDFVQNPKREQSLGELVSSLPSLFMGLVKDEVEQGKREVSGKVSKLKTAIIAGVIAAFLAITLWAVLITAAVLGLNVVLQPWASALVVAGVLRLIILILVLGFILPGIKKAMPLMPERTKASIEQDINALKGTGQYE